MRNAAIPLLLTAAMTTSLVGEQEKEEKPVETAKELWKRLEPTLPQLAWKIEKDEIVPSDTDPRQKLRRVEVKFYSQEFDGQKWGHPCVVFMSADPQVHDTPPRRGKVVIVGQRGWGRPGHRTVARRVPGQLRRAHRRADGLSDDDLPRAR